MTRLLAGAMALALLGGSAAIAQPNNPDHNGGYRAGGDQNGGGDQAGGGDHRANGHDDSHHGRTVCTRRHHHRVCYHRHW